MSAAASADESVVRRFLAEHHYEVDVIGDTEPANEGMIQVLVETEVFVVGGEAIDVVSSDVNDVINEWSSTGEMV